MLKETTFPTRRDDLNGHHSLHKPTQLLAPAEKNEQIMLSPTNLSAYSQLSRGINLQARSIAHSNPTDSILLQTMKLVTL